MKKVLAIVLAALLIVAALAGCAAKSETADTTATTDTAAAETTDGKLEVLKVGASSTPHAEILEQVKDTLAAEGYDLQIVVYDDYVLPNQSLADGSLDANYFQHTPYLNSFNAANGTDLVSAGKIHYEPFGLYGNGVDSVDAIASDATILIPADDSNETRALLLLAQEGLIELPADASAEKGVTTLMVTHNMNDAIRLGNRLIMMHEGHVIYDVAGDEKKSLTVADLLQKFEEVSGGELANDRMLLS